MNNVEQQQLADNKLVEHERNDCLKSFYIFLLIE